MITIIGSGLAGYTLAKEIRKLNQEIPLRIITETNGNFYSKPILSNVLTLKKELHQLVTASAEKMQNDLNIELLNFHTVKSIDTLTKTITADDLNLNQTKNLSYEYLIFATGSIPNPVQFDGVYQVNSLEDYAIWHDALNQKEVQKIAIMGGGLIGCEFANDLRKGGYHVVLIDSGKNPLGRLLPNEAGLFLKNHLLNAGIEYHSDSKVTSVFNNKKNYNINLENKSNSNEKTVLEVDLVLGAIGIQPNLILAKQTGLNISHAITVNQFLETSIESVYALGDCAEVNGFWLPYVAPIMQSARALAKTLVGEKTAVTYPNMPVIVKTGFCPTVIGVPNRQLDQTGFWQWEQTDENNLKGLFLNSNHQLLGFILMGSKMIVQRQALANQLDALI